jgi:metal-responsive CopG/Arc/MetJ family transcriptional regulator
MDDEMDQTSLSPVSMRLPATTLAALDRAAAAEGRSRSNMARRLLEAGLGAQNAQASPAMAAGGHS